MSSNRQRRDGDRRPSDRSNDRRDRDDRRDSQPDDEQQRRPNDPDLQESDSLIALKAILGKVAGLLTSLKLTQDESISLVEQLYGSVLDMDLKLAGETDDKRKASVQAHIQKTNITRSGGKLVVEFPKMETPKEDASSSEAPAKPQAEAPDKAVTTAREPTSASPKPQSTPEVAAKPADEPAGEPIVAEPVAEPKPEPASAPSGETTGDSVPEPSAESEQADA